MKHLRTIAVLAVLAVPAAACGTGRNQDTATNRPHVTASGAPDLSGGRCHLSKDEVDNWGETSARLESICADG